MKLFKNLARWTLLAGGFALTVAPALAQAPSGPNRGSEALTDYFLIEMAKACDEVTDRAWVLDVSRRIKDFVLRTEGMTHGTGRLLGISEVTLGLADERIRSKLHPDAPTVSPCTGIDWAAVRERGERYRCERRLDKPIRR